MAFCWTFLFCSRKIKDPSQLSSRQHSTLRLRNLSYRSKSLLARHSVILAISISLNQPSITTTMRWQFKEENALSEYLQMLISRFFLSLCNAISSVQLMRDSTRKGNQLISLFCSIWSPYALVNDMRWLMIWGDYHADSDHFDLILVVKAVSLWWGSTKKLGVMTHWMRAQLLRNFLEKGHSQFIMLVLNLSWPMRRYFLYLQS